MSLGRILQRFRVLGCLAGLALSSACQRHEVVADSLVLDREPVTLAFRTPYVTDGPTREVCFEFEQGPVRAKNFNPLRLSVVLIDTAGVRDTLGGSEGPGMTWSGPYSLCLYDHGLDRTLPGIACVKQSDWPARRCTVSEDSMRVLEAMPDTRRAVYGALEISASGPQHIRRITWWSGRRIGSI